MLLSERLLTVRSNEGLGMLTTLFPDSVQVWALVGLEVWTEVPKILRHAGTFGL